MDIPGTVPPLLLSLTSPNAAAPSWSPGQVLNAVVDAILPGDRMVLRIGGTLLEAGGSDAFSIGQRLNLQVVANEASLLLKVLSPDGVQTAAPANAAPAAPTSAPGAVLTLRTALPTALGAEPGTVLQATVTARDDQQVTLAIEGLSVLAHASQSVSAGQRLILQVVQATRPAILQVVGQNSIEEALRAALRATLPRQAPLQEVFARLSALPTPPAGAPAALLMQLLQNLPQVENLTRDDALQAALQNAGQFLEQRLQRDAPAEELRRDLKANLLRLLGALSQMPAEADLSHEVEAAVARIQLHQLAAVSPEQPAPAWLGELPLRHGDNVNVCRLQIEKDGGKGAEHGSSGWNTWVSLELPALGPLHARLALAGLRLSATFWAESDATFTLVSEHLAHLRQALVDAGLEVGDLLCHSGRPPLLPPDRLLAAGLLDILV